MINGTLNEQSTSDSVSTNFEEQTDVPDLETAENSVSTTANPGNTTIPTINLSSKMGDKQRVPRMWPLSKDETINSFESWRGNFLYTLNMDTNFAPFLVSNKTWEKKIKGGSDHRGLSNAQERNFLEMLLGQIANFCPVISRKTIINNSTSIESV